MSPLDPAYSGTSRKRLAEISHIFLSEPEEHTIPARKTFFLPILVLPGGEDVFVYLLARALHARRIQTMVMHLDPKLQRRDPRLLLPPALPDSPDDILERIIHADNVKPMPDVCLLPSAGWQRALPAEWTHAVIVFPGETAALPRAYMQIKQLVNRECAPVTGIILTQTTHEDLANRLFNRLAEGCGRFLGYPLYFLGWYPATGPAQSVMRHADISGAVNPDNDALNGIITKMLRAGFTGGSREKI